MRILYCASALPCALRTDEFYEYGYERNLLNVEDPYGNFMRMYAEKPYCFKIFAYKKQEVTVAMERRFTGYSKIEFGSAGFL